MYVEPGTFEDHIRFLRDRFRIAPLSEIPGVLGKRSALTGNRPLCVLTFDDGWYDFYEFAYPVLKAYKAPATVFLPTAFIGTGKWFWTDRLMHILLQLKHRRLTARPDRVSSHQLVRRLESMDDFREPAIEKAICQLKTRRNDEIEAVCSELAERWDLEPPPPVRAFLSWEEVGEMAGSGLVSFGSHTATHRILTTLTDDEIKEELIHSRETLISRNAAERSFMPFCYPNGNHTPEIADMVREAGYHLAVTTGSGWNHPGSDLFTLRRIAIHQDMTSTEAMFGCRIANIV